MMDRIVLIVLAILVTVVVALFLQFVPISRLMVAQAAGVEDVTMGALIQMRVRGIHQRLIVLPLIAAVKAGVPLSLTQLERHYMAGGKVDRVVLGLIAANRAGIPSRLGRQWKWICPVRTYYSL